MRTLVSYLYLLGLFNFSVIVDSAEAHGYKSGDAFVIIETLGCDWPSITVLHQLWQADYYYTNSGLHVHNWWDKEEIRYGSPGYYSGCNSYETECEDEDIEYYLDWCYKEGYAGDEEDEAAAAECREKYADADKKVENFMTITYYDIETCENCNCTTRLIR